MTGLTRRVVRETNVPDSTKGGRRPLCVMLEEGGRILRIKPKGLRTWYEVPYAALYTLAIRIRAVAIKAEKKAAKEAKRKEQQR